MTTPHVRTVHPRLARTHEQTTRVVFANSHANTHTHTFTALFPYIYPMQCAVRAYQLCPPGPAVHRSTSIPGGHHVSTSGAQAASLVGEQRRQPRHRRRDDAAVNAGDGPVSEASTGAYASALVFPRRICLHRRPSPHLASTTDRRRAFYFFLFSFLYIFFRLE